MLNDERAVINAVIHWIDYAIYCCNQAKDIQVTDTYKDVIHAQWCDVAWLSIHHASEALNG